MDGARAYQYLRKMSAEERKGVRIIWFDRDLTENFYGDDYDEKMKFVDSLSGEKQGELIEKAMYSDGGDYLPSFDNYIDDVANRLEALIADEMAKSKAVNK